MSDDRPINAKPFSSATSLITQSGTTISDVSKLAVTSLSKSDQLANSTSNSSSSSQTSKLLINSSSNQPGGTLTHSAAVTKANQDASNSNQDQLPNDNNNQTQDISTENQLKQYLTNLAPNILNSYDQATYHLKLFIANAADITKNQELSIEELVQKKPTIFDDANILIIAESGVNAGIYVESFNITNVVAIDPQFNTSGVTATLVLKEPLGANFIDYFNGAIDSMGYETRAQTPIFIEISFRGYDENGNYMEVDSIGTKMYRMMMKNISAQFTGTGAEYTIDLAIFSDVARQMAHASLHDNLTVQGRTVKEFLDKVIAEFNKYQKDTEADNKQPPPPNPSNTTQSANTPPAGKDSSNKQLQTTDSSDKPTPTEKNVYAYYLDPKTVQYSDCLTWEVGKASSPDRHRSADTVYADSGTDTKIENKKGTMEATWAAGTDKMAILYDILYSTKEAQSLIVNGKKDGEIKPGSKPPGGISYLPEFDLGVEFLDYNNETHTYNKKITFHIQERQSTQIFTTPDELKKASDNPEALKEKMAFVRRRYDYFGTGKNTEIIDFAIKVEKDLLINLPAYNAQKRTSVADNPGTGSKPIQQAQVAGSNKATLSQGVKPPSPTDPDASKTKKDPTDGTKTSPETLSADSSTNTTNPVLNNSSASPAQATNLTQSQYTDQLVNITNQAKILDSQYLALSPDQQIARKDEFNSKYAQLGQQMKVIKASAPTTASIYSDANSAANAQLSSILGKARSLDSVSQDTRYLTQSGNNTNTSSTPSGTSQYGATTDYNNNVAVTPTARNDSLTGTKRFLEDLSRDRADSPKGDIVFTRPTASTSIHSSGGYNLDDSSTLGKSYITALLGQVYGARGDMNSVNMEVRGDPLWLDVTNKAHTDQMGSLVIKNKNGKIITPADHKILLVVVFPTQYDENTGLAIPNKIAEGYTALYNINNIVSNFQDGKFTQTLQLYQDLCTEQVRKYIDPKGGANL